MTREELAQALITDGYLRTPAIIAAFEKIDRKDFVPEEHAHEAYGNYPLPIGHGQTISQPLTVAFMLELLQPVPGEKILDVGAGSGWQTALLTELVGKTGKVIAIERLPDLAAMAERNVARYGGIEQGIVKVVQGDGSKGMPDEAPFDRIIAAAAARSVPLAWKGQLKIGGRMVLPVRESIYVLDKTGPDEFTQQQYFGFSFVPLVVGDGRKPLTGVDKSSLDTE